ncbi:unnamed protein product, partial [Vitis vinifera]
MEYRKGYLPVVHLDPFSKKYVELKTNLSRTERHILIKNRGRDKERDKDRERER